MFHLGQDLVRGFGWKPLCVSLLVFLPQTEAGASPASPASVEGAVPTADEPAVDGWPSEAFERQVGLQLLQLKKWVVEPQSLSAPLPANLTVPELELAPLRPELQRHWQDGSLAIDLPTESGSIRRSFRGAAGLRDALAELGRPFVSLGETRIKIKTVGVEMAGDRVETRHLVSITARGSASSLEEHAEWTLGWQPQPGDAAPVLLSLEATNLRRAGFGSDGPATLFSDRTASVLGGERVWREQLLRGPDYWLSQIEAGLGTDIMGHSGLALGDVDGDGLEDLYLPQQGGLPNLLLLQNADGTVREAGAVAGVDWLDRSHSALLLDLDNDGDQDLVLSTALALVMMSNDGSGRFTLRATHPGARFAYSLAAADFDADGDVDIYATRYSPLRGDPVEESVDVPNPIPYHDARNGAPNVLLRNEGSWRFVDATEDVGLEQENRRWSFAASWEDFDNDGDVDLYVANDFGRNGLYRNDDGFFVNVAESAGVEDIASGMSVTWGDVDRDGRMDLYVSNMFSSAGNRVSYQPNFQPGMSPESLAQVRRLAKGNTLYLNQGEGGFEDLSHSAGVSMGRWAWGSLFFDMNNDGWQDLVVANGFLTATNPDDL